MFKAKIFLVFICLFVGFKCFAQNHFIQFICNDSLELKKYTSTRINVQNKNLVQQNIDKIFSAIKSKGFISASIDSIIEKENISFAYLFLGKKYTFKHIDLPIELVDSFSKTNVEILPQAVLNYYQNNGYPFAKVGFDGIVFITENEIKASLNIDKGNAYNLDFIRVVGNLDISNNFLSHYLQLPFQTPYNESILKKIDSKLAQLNFVQLTQPTNILMLNTGYVVNVYAQAKRVNRFDVIFGLLPNNTQANGNLLFTIDANIGLVNAFAKGETINFMWQQIQPKSPRLDIGFALPYIFKSNAQFNFKFNLYKRDSAFLNINTDLGLSYNIDEKSKFGFYFNNFSGRIITPDTNSIIQTKKLPSFLDINIANLGVEYSHSNHFAQKININKGFDFRLSASFGNKTIKENSTITSLKTNGFNYKSLYDSLEKNTYQLKAKIVANYYLPLSKFSTLKIAANSGIIQTAQVFQNEQFQIGGFKLLRGFDEENIFTNKYLVTTLEYRYSINKNSFFYVFNDVGFTNNSIINQNYQFTSGGLGLALATKQGILNFCLAGGKRNDLVFNFRETKIHVGLINNF